MPTRIVEASLPLQPFRISISLSLPQHLTRKDEKRGENFVVPDIISPAAMFLRLSTRDRDVYFEGEPGVADLYVTVLTETEQFRAHPRKMKSKPEAFRCFMEPPSSVLLDRANI